MPRVRKSLSRGSAVRRVTRAGKPVPFVVVTATPADDQSVRAKGEAAPSGQYVIEGLMKGYHLVTAEHTHTKGAKIERVYVSEDTQLNMSFRPSVSLAMSLTP